MEEIVGQICGIIAMLFSILTFQMNTHKKMMVMQINCAAFFVVSYWLLNEPTGAVVNIVSIVRNAVFYHRDKRLFSGKGWVIGFAVAMALGGLLSWNGPVSLLMIVAMVFNTLSVSCTDPQMVRKIMLLSSPLTLIYNSICFSVGGIANSSLAIISTVSALVRTAKKQQQTDGKKDALCNK